jgi:hypothetical protein
MPNTFLPHFAPGTPVTSSHWQRHGEQFVVVRTKVTRAHVVPANDLTHRGYEHPLEFLAHSTDAAGNRLPLVTLPAPAPAPERSGSDGVEQASIIRLRRPFQHYTTQDLLVVSSVNQRTVSAKKLGGESGPGLRVGFGGFEVVDPSRLTLAV